MISKVLLKIIIFSFSTNIIIAQKIRVTYNIKYKPDSTQSTYKESNMLLDVYDSNLSRFYSEKLFKSDSIRINGNHSQYYSLDFNSAIVKDKNILKKYYRILTDVYEVAAKSPNLEWKITSNTKKIGNYSCQQATSYYKNRYWTAWFTTDVPISEGPSLFKGLPGLIVWVSDDKGNYEFSLQKVTKKFYDPYNGVNFKTENVVKVNKEQLNKIYINYYLDPYKEAKMGKIKVNFVDQDGNELKNINWNELTKIKQKEIKKFNNPLELLDAVKYPK